LWPQTCKVHLVSAPGCLVEYSDFVFILLGAAPERMMDEPLDRFCNREIFPQFGRLVSFNFRKFPFSSWIPPTEKDRAFRHRVVGGEVNDENAWVMGGVAGHAGCFAPARDVAAFAQIILNGGAPLFQRHTVDLFTQ